MTSSKQQKMISFWFVMPFTSADTQHKCVHVCVCIVNRPLRKIMEIFAIPSLPHSLLALASATHSHASRATHMLSYGISMTTQNTFSLLYCLKSVGLPSHTHDAHNLRLSFHPAPTRAQNQRRHKMRVNFRVVRNKTFDCHLHGDGALTPHKPIINFNDTLIEDATQID